jgi:hypothetical protein
MNILIDKEDEYLLSKYRWRVVNGYLATNDIGFGELIYLHRVLVGAKRGERVEFINGDRTDYRRENLRINRFIKWKNRPTKRTVRINGRTYKVEYFNNRVFYRGQLR